MPSTVHVSESTRSSLRVLIVVAAIVVLLIPIAFTVAHGASRMNYGKVDVSEPLSTNLKELKLNVAEATVSVRIKTSETDAPGAQLTGSGPDDETPDLTVSETGTSSSVSVENEDFSDNYRLTVTLPAATSKNIKLVVDGDQSSVDAEGNFKEIVAATGSGSIDISGDTGRVETSTDLGSIDMRGSFDSIDATTDSGSIDGSNLTVRDRVNASTSMGSVSLDFSNEAAPKSGISAKAEDGSIDLRLPRLDLVKEKADNDPATEDEANKDDAAKPAGELFYQINATSSDGEVDLAEDLEQYRVSKDSQATAGKTVIPVTAASDSGEISIDQN